MFPVPHVYFLSESGLHAWFSPIYVILGYIHPRARSSRPSPKQLFFHLWIEGNMRPFCAVNSRVKRSNHMDNLLLEGMGIAHFPQGLFDSFSVDQFTQSVRSLD
ncbi:hypothetical protein BYT27DRAFT_6373945 [Phlegmacium glaucopus]|nr:hypothetical protein BYT27DRAFT_6373945 [Phlegmacium glaucopus]